MNIIDPQLPGIRILDPPDRPEDGVMFQNLWDGPIIGMNWEFRFIKGTTASSGSDDLNQFRLYPGEVAVGVPHRLYVVNRTKHEELRFLEETLGLQGLPGTARKNYAALQQRCLERARLMPPPSLPTARNLSLERLLAGLPNLYIESGVPPESIPSVDDLKRQSEESQSKPGSRLKPIPEQIKLLWLLFEDGLFFGALIQAHSVILARSLRESLRPFVTSASREDLSFDHPVAKEFRNVLAEASALIASGAKDLSPLVERLPESDRKIIKKIMPIPGNDNA